MLLNRADGADWASWAVSGQHIPSLGPEAQKAETPKKRPDFAQIVPVSWSLGSGTRLRLASLGKLGLRLGKQCGSGQDTRRA